MALIIYKGTTKKLLLELKDSSDVQIKAGDVYNAEIYLRNGKTGELYAKYSKVDQTADGFILATIVDDKFQVVVDVDVTEVMEVGELEIYTKTFQVDADFDGGYSVSPNKGVLAYVKEI